MFVGGKLAAAKQGPTKENLHIFYSELSVALGGVSEASRMGHVSATSYIDNAAAAGAMQRCASSNFRANKWLQNRMIEDVRVQWVSTTKMLADPYTRVPTGHSGPVPLPPLGITIQEAAARLAEDQARKPKDRTEPKGLAPVGRHRGWLCAARPGEIAPLRKENVVAIQSDPCILAVTFPESKADLHKLGVAMVTYPGAWTLEILEHLAALGPRAQVSSLTTERAAAILARVNPTLSAHSVKRGALTTLLRANVPLSIIQTIAKHRDLEMTFLYLPRVEVALHLGLHEASRVLAPT